MGWRIGEILVQKKWIDWWQLQEALEEQQRTKEYTGSVLVRKGYLSNFLLHQALAEQFHIRFVDLPKTRINPQAIEKIPRSIAQKYSLIPIELHGDVLQVGISNPLNTWPESELKQLAGVKEIKTVLCMPADIQKAIEEQYGKSAPAPPPR